MTPYELTDLLNASPGSIIRVGDGNPYLGQLQSQALAQSALNAQMQNLLGISVDACCGLSTGDAFRNAAPRPPERKNQFGQTYREWRDGLEGRIGMMEASGIGMTDAEERRWQAEADEWKTIS